MQVLGPVKLGGWAASGDSLPHTLEGLGVNGFGLYESAGAIESGWGNINAGNPWDFAELGLGLLGAKGNLSGLGGGLKKLNSKLGADYLPGKAVSGHVANPATMWEASTTPQGFNSFEKLKKALGPAGEGKQWHHIVEQHDFNIAKFGAKAIHNVDNVVPISAELNQKLNAVYSAPLPGITGSSLTVREWLKTKTLQQNYNFGKAALHYVSEGLW